MIVRKLLILGVAVVAATVNARAEEPWLGDASDKYPTIVGTPLNSCSLCHTSVPSRNSYGDDYKDHNRNFDSIKDLDSDGDGFSNIDEINAHTFPGNSSSHPTVAATIRVKSPNGGEVLVQGEKVVVKWSSTGNPGANVNIELWQGGAKVRNLKANTPNDGKQKIKVPTTAGTGTDFAIKIVSATNASISDTSNVDFTIAALAP